jgi:hypothetical protein
MQAGVCARFHYRGIGVRLSALLGRAHEEHEPQDGPSIVGAERWLQGTASLAALLASLG